MDRSQIVVLASYAVGGLLVTGCAFAPGRSWVFRVWCVVLGGYVAAWPIWLMRAEDVDMPFRWRIGPLAVPLLLLLITLPGTIQRRRARARHRFTPLPEIEEPDPEAGRYPADVPLGQMAPPHDPWRALYDSLARQRAKWEVAIKTLPKQVAPYLMLRHHTITGSREGLREAALLGKAWGITSHWIVQGITGTAMYFTGFEGLYAAYEAVDDLLD